MIIITIRSPGTDPFTTRQHISALSQRNKEQFLEKMGAAAPVVGELAKVKPGTWRTMKGFFSSLEAVGRSGILTNFTGRIQQAALLPMNVLQNRVAFMLEGLMMPLLPVINKITVAYENYITQNSTGALIGAGLGFIIGAKFGHPVVGAVIGSTIGAAVEDLVDLAALGLEAFGRAWKDLWGGSQLASGWEAYSATTLFGGGTDSTGTGDPGEGYVSPLVSTATPISGRTGRLRLI